jgi:hypothetical protein
MIHHPREVIEQGTKIFCRRRLNAEKQLDILPWRIKEPYDETDESGV